VIKGLTENRAETDPHSPDWRLRGRTYAISFDRVWTAALGLASGGLARWTLLSANDEDGIIRARALTRFFRRVDDVRINVGLDSNGQTRVDLVSESLKRKRDLGGNARRIHRFVGELDAKLGATPSQILDATREPHFSA
jgi:hypothetical protein